MKLSYSSPQAYLNRFFKGQSKFKYTTDDCGCDAYQNGDWQLSWIDGEMFVLARRMIDSSVGADWYEDEFQGQLTDCVEYIRQQNRKDRGL